MSNERKPGFTCPNCGSHYFGSYTYHNLMGNKHEHGARIGACHGYHYDGRACRFEWNRDDSEAEGEAINQLTKEEWERQLMEVRTDLSDFGDFFVSYEMRNHGN